jgi:hypothetical protein
VVKKEKNMVAIKERIDIDIKQVLSNLGYNNVHKLPARMVTLLSDYIDYANNIIDPSYSYVIRDIELVLGPHVIVEDSIIFDSEIVAQLLKQCEKVAIFVTTIGGYLEETVSQLAEDGLAQQAVVLDAIGSSAVEKMANLVQEMIEEEARTQGLHISRRFSPGHCDWNVKQQKIVFQAINVNSAGIQLTEGCLMLPRKSVSGIIGLGPPYVAEYNPCPTCKKHDCIGRKIEFSKSFFQ